MAPWWLRSSKDESYEDDLDIDDKTLESIAIEPEPRVPDEGPSAGGDAAQGNEEEAFSIGWEPGTRSAKPPAAGEWAQPESTERRSAQEPADTEPAEEEKSPEKSKEEPAPSRKRRRRRKRRKASGDAATESEPKPAKSTGKPKPAKADDSEPKPAAKVAVEASSVEATTQQEIIFDFGPHERSATASDERKIALFCDLENIALGVRSSETKKFDINLVLERLLEKGKIIVKKAYADWERYSDFKRTFHEAAIELIDIPQKHYSGKNSADIKMVVDAMDLCFSKEHLDTFVILSGDSDFSPLVSKLKENNKYVIGVGVKGSTSGHLIDNCDEFIYYEDVWRDLQRTPNLDHLSPKEAEVFGLLIDAILALVRENKSVLWGSMIKQTMKRKRPSFSEGYYGYSAFRDLLEDAHKKNIILLKRDQRSGNYVVTGFGQ